VSLLLNTKTDALAALAATLALPADTTYHLTVATYHLLCPRYSLEISEVHTTSTNFKLRNWRFPIIDYTLHGILPDDPKEVAFVRRRSTQFYCDAVAKTMYHRSNDGILLHYLSNLKVREVLKEDHGGICGAHQPGPKIKDRLHRLGCYWPTMITDAVEYARRCKAYQIHTDFIHQPPELLQPIVISLPFEAWGINVVGPISPQSAKGHRFILAITYYSSKWAEVTPLAKVKIANVVNFIKHHVIHRFGVPRRIIRDNGLRRQRVSRGVQ